MSDEVETTLLVIEETGVPVYSARGLTQTLEPIAAASSLRRTVNGALHDLSAPQFRKFSSSITCNDQQAPAFDGLAIGAEVTVHCVVQVGFRTLTGTRSRAYVTDSLRVEGEFTFYRPLLYMRVTGFSQQEDEYGAVIGWTLQLEEV